MVPKEDYITIAEAASLLGTADSAVRSAISRGLIRYTRVFGPTLVNKRSVEEYKFLHLQKTNNIRPKN